MEKKILLLIFNVSVCFAAQDQKSVEHHAIIDQLAKQIEISKYDLALAKAVDSNLDESQRKKLCGAVIHKNINLIRRHIPTGYTSVILGAHVHSIDFPYDSAVQAVAVNHTRDLVLMAAQNSKFDLRYINLDADKIKLLGSYSHQAPLTSIALSPDGTNKLYGMANGLVQRYDITNPSPAQFRGSFIAGKSNDLIQSVSYSPNGIYALAGSTNKNAYLLDLTDQQRLIQLAQLPHADFVNGVIFSRDNRYGITVCENGVMAIWNLEQAPTVTKTSAMRAHDRAVNTVDSTSHSEAAHIILTGSDDATAKIWDISNPAQPIEQAILKGHSQAITCVKFLPNYFIALTASKDGTIRLWHFEDLRNPVCLRILGENDGAIYSADFGPNLDYIVAGTWQNKARLWLTGDASISPDLSFIQLVQLIKLLKSTEAHILNREEYRQLVQALPENLQNYLQKLHALQATFPREITDIIIGYVGNSFAYNYQTETAVQPPSSSGCAIS